jgi:hypothetical protein
VIGGADRPASCWLHELRAGAQISWQEPPVGHALYVLSGEVMANGKRLRAGSALLVEHRGQALVRAGTSGSTLLHCHRADAQVGAAAGDGGRSHAVDPEGLFKAAAPAHGHVGTYWADGSCETCDLWLHESRYDRPGHQVPRHFHNVDEIMFIVHGEMVLGRRRLTAGTALAIDANTTYTFRVGDPGLAFINFRPGDPSVVFFRPEGRQGPVSEREIANRNRVSSS